MNMWSMGSSQQMIVIMINIIFINLYLYTKQAQNKYSSQWPVERTFSQFPWVLEAVKSLKKNRYVCQNSFSCKRRLALSTQGQIGIYRKGYVSSEGHLLPVIRSRGPNNSTHCIWVLESPRKATVESKREHHFIPQRRSRPRSAPIAGASLPWPTGSS